MVFKHLYKKQSESSLFQTKLQQKYLMKIKKKP